MPLTRIKYPYANDTLSLPNVLATPTLTVNGSSNTSDASLKVIGSPSQSTSHIQAWQNNSGSNLAYIDSSGNLYLSREDSSTRLVISSSSASQAFAGSPGLSIANYTGNSISSNSNITFLTARGSSSSPTSILNNQILGSIDFIGHNGNSYASSASISATASANYNLTDISTYLSFKTALLNVQTERFRVGPGGLIRIFGGTTADADPEFTINGVSGYINFHNALSAGNYNPNTATNDKGIIFTDGTVDTGSFIIAPWSNTSGGLKINGTGQITIANGLTITAGGLAINQSSPSITSNNASAASIFTSSVTGITIGSSTIKTTVYPADGTTSTAATGSGFMGMPQNLNPATNYNFAASDAGKHIYMTTTGRTLNIPANTTTAFPIGTTIVIINANGVSTTITITTDTLRLANTTSTGTRTLASNGMATLVKTNTTEWIIGGNGIS